MLGRFLPWQLGLVRLNFELHGLPARFLHAPPHRLPLAAASVDVVCLDGLLHELDRPGDVLDEVYRVLRPGGKVIAVAPAKYGSAYWKDALFPWRRWFRCGVCSTGGYRYPPPNSPVRRPEEMGFALIAASASGSAAPARRASFFGSA